jgi:predicted RecB family nuclease
MYNKKAPFRAYARQSRLYFMQRGTLLLIGQSTPKHRMLQCITYLPGISMLNSTNLVKENVTITDDVLIAYSICPRKAYQILFLENEYKDKHYTNYLKRRIKLLEDKYLRSAKCSLPFSSDRLFGKADFITNAKLNTGNLEVTHVHLKKCDLESKLGNYSYEPLIFSPSTALTKKDRILASYIDHVLSEIQSISTSKATIVFISGETKRIRINPKISIPALNQVREWITSEPDPPPIVFNKHCPQCQFEDLCLSTAEQEDSISLLGNMPLKAQNKYEAKGIFTIRQLSYLYKPRRRTRRNIDRKPIHKYELQALALRTGMIYTDKLIEPSSAGVEIFVDIESFPENRFHYLIGTLISTPESDHYFPLWANSANDEKDIWQDFLKIVHKYPDAPIFHYGSYEKKAIKELGARYNTDVEMLCTQLDNVNNYIFGRIYFPTRTNKLKDICQYLGLTWTADNPSGLESIIWRYEYKRTGNSKIKDKLITYNHEDCANLKELKFAIQDICRDTAKPNVRAVSDQNQSLSNSSRKVVKEFSAILRSAHGKYEQSKISLRNAKRKSNKIDKRCVGRPSIKAIPKSIIDKLIRVPRGRICPMHKRALMQTGLMAESIVIDLVSTPKGIKKTVTKYWGEKGRCPNCSHRHIPPGLRKLNRYGDGLKSWVAYQRLAMRLPFAKISQLFEDTFNIWIASGGVHTLFKSITPRYKKTEKLILNELLNSPKIHADETQVNIQGKNQYVWVFCDGSHVIFRLTPTREADIAHEVLQGYEGVLVSDFYAGYDSIPCRQQKCWVHLIRDINDDLRKSPFDSELELLAKSLRDLLVPIFHTIEKYGSKARNLRKHKRDVENFYKKYITDTCFKSDTAKKYQKRFSRYRESLFLFLEYDEIPWNNNMAERALRHIAVQRKISGSFFASSMTDYLVLLGVAQTCRFQNKPLLSFLMSGEENMDRFKGRKNLKGWQMK